MSGKRSSRKRRPATGPPEKAPAAKDPPAKRSHAKALPAKAPPAKREPEKPAVADIPPRMVAIAYVLALLCLVTPLTVLGSGFAGAVLFTRGMRREGAGVIVVSVVCVAVGFFLRTQ
jgi:hypothetical protein